MLENVLVFPTRYQNNKIYGGAYLDFTFMIIACLVFVLLLKNSLVRITGIYTAPQPPPPNIPQIEGTPKPG